MKNILFLILILFSCQSKEEKIAVMNSQIDSLKVKSLSLESELKFEVDWNKKNGGSNQGAIGIETRIFNIKRSIDSINSEIINLNNE